jgi:hypothetical protein
MFLIDIHPINMLKQEMQHKTDADADEAHRHHGSKKASKPEHGDLSRVIVVGLEGLHLLIVGVGHLLSVRRVGIVNTIVIVQFCDVVQVDVLHQVREHNIEDKGIGESIDKAIVYPHGGELDDVVRTEEENSLV